MSKSNETLIGHVVDVQGDGLTANLLADEQEVAPKVTVGCPQYSPAKRRTAPET